MTTNLAQKHLTMTKLSFLVLLLSLIVLDAKLRGENHAFAKQEQRFLMMSSKDGAGSAPVANDGTGESSPQQTGPVYPENAQQITATTTSGQVVTITIIPPQGSSTPVDETAPVAEGEPSDGSGSPPSSGTTGGDPTITITQP